MTNGAKMKMHRTLLRISLIVIVVLSMQSCIADGGGGELTPELGNRRDIEAYAQENRLDLSPTGELGAILLSYCENLRILNAAEEARTEEDELMIERRVEGSSLCDCMYDNTESEEGAELESLGACAWERQGDIEYFCSYVIIPESAEELYEWSDEHRFSTQREMVDVMFCYNINTWTSK